MIRRRRFFQLLLVASAAASIMRPLVASDDHGSFVQLPSNATVVKAGVDRDEAPIKSVEAIFHVKVSGKGTEGRCVVFDTLRPEKVGPRLHLHIDCDEGFFVREDDFKFQVGADIMRLTWRFAPGPTERAPRFRKNERRRAPTNRHAPAGRYDGRVPLSAGTG